MEECMLTCPKLDRARVPASNTMEELQEVLRLNEKFLNIPGINYGFIWLAITDKEEEGVWRDYYTRQAQCQVSSPNKTSEIEILI